MFGKNGSIRNSGGSAAIGAVDPARDEHDDSGLEKAGHLKQRQIYFAECDGRIKIGISGNVQQRLSQLRTGAGGQVKLIAAVDGDETIERALHRKLRAFHIDGEWFKDCAETRAAIQNSLNNFPKAAADRKSRLGINKTFPLVAKAIWPRKTASYLAAIGGVDERTATRWLSGENEPPGIIIAAIVHEITKRD